MSSHSPINLFIRQPFTESSAQEQGLVEGVLNAFALCDGHPYRFNYLTGKKAQRADTFRQDFVQTTGKDFSPVAFRQHRLKILQEADLFVNIRVAMSESTAFELGYYHSRCDFPLLFLVWNGAPIKTTLLQDLGGDIDTQYMLFDDPAELVEPLKKYFDKFDIFNSTKII